MLATCMWVDHFRMSLITVALYYLKNPNRRREQVFFSPLLRDLAVWVLYFESKGAAVALWLVTGLSSLGFSLGQIHCVVFFGKTLYDPFLPNCLFLFCTVPTFPRHSLKGIKNILTFSYSALFPS